jgi:hypothetical protein
MTFVAALAPGGDGLGAGLLLAIWGAAAALTLVELQPSRIIEQSRSSLTALRMSPEAREAVERARRRVGSLPPVLLLDVGLIALQTSERGMTMRRQRDLSGDDDGARPFAVLHVPPEAAERNATVRFEFIDRNGQTGYLHEMTVYLRDGEMNLLPDTQMPLYMNEQAVAGDWDLRVFVDNRLIGAHAFTLAPSLEDRFPRAARRRLSEAPAEDEAPVRLEDLLREDPRQQRGG